MSLWGSKTVEATKAEVLGDAEFSELFPHWIYPADYDCLWSGEGWLLPSA